MIPHRIFITAEWLPLDRHAWVGSRLSSANINHDGLTFTPPRWSLWGWAGHIRPQCRCSFEPGQQRAIPLLLRRSPTFTLERCPDISRLGRHGVFGFLKARLSLHTHGPALALAQQWVKHSDCFFLGASIWFGAPAPCGTACTASHQHPRGPGLGRMGILRRVTVVSDTQTN